MRDLTVSHHTGALADLAGDWSRLLDESHPGAPFRAFPWISAWWKSASTSREPEVLVAREDGEVVGILPLYREPSLGGSRLRAMGDGVVGSDYLGPLARKNDHVRIARAFAVHLVRSGAPELALDDLAHDDPLAAALAERGVALAPRYLCPFVKTNTGDFDTYLNALPDGIAAQWRRRRRWLEKAPGFRIDELTAPDDVVSGMRILFDLHRKRWALEGGSDAIDGPRVEHFHVEAARGLAELGWARVYVLHVEGAPRAALYGFRHGNRFAFYQAGHEPAWRPRSVGTVLLGDVIRRCFAEKLDEFDFLRGSEPYKLKWANGWRETVSARARATGLRPWLASGGERALSWLRAATRQALPEEWVDWVRARRRELIASRGGST